MITQKQSGFDRKLIHGNHPPVLNSRGISNWIILSDAYSFPHIETVSATVAGHISIFIMGNMGIPH